MILKKQLEEWAEKNDILTQTQDQVIKKRKKNMVARTFFECGIVVPVNKKTKVGYRKIPETNGEESIASFIHYHCLRTALLKINIFFSHQTT